MKIVVEIMDEFGCFDPKLPASDKSPDWRTSTYRGHRHITDTRLGSKLNAPSECSNKGIFVRDPLLHEKQLTEISSNYVWKVSCGFRRRTEILVFTSTYSPCSIPIRMSCGILRLI